MTDTKHTPQGVELCEHGERAHGTCPACQGYPQPTKPSELARVARAHGLEWHPSQVRALVAVATECLTKSARVHPDLQARLRAALEPFTKGDV